MNLFARLIVVFIRALLSKQRIILLNETRLTYRVWLLDQDMFAHMTNSRYLSFSDLGTINHIIRIGSWPVLRKRGWIPVICGQSMVISRMLSMPEKFELVTKIVAWTDAYVCLSHKFIRGETEHAEVQVIAKFAARDKSKVRPQEMVDAIGLDLVSPELPDSFAHLIARVEACRARARKPKNA